MVTFIHVRAIAVVAAIFLQVTPGYGQSLPVWALAKASPGSSRSAAGGPQPLAPGQTLTGPVRRLTMEEAVTMALEQNLDIQVERLNPRIQDLGIAQARSAWTPRASTTMQARSQDSPANSFLSGGQAKVSDDLLSTSIGIDQLLPWGGSYSVGWDGSRASTTNIFTNFDPILRSNLSVSYVQPLVRNYRIDTARQQLLITRKNREISDIALRRTVVSTIRNVRNAYWELAFAYSSLDVQRQSLELAQQSLRDTRTRVQIGTMAPIDIVEAEAEVARNEEAVIVAEAGIQQAEDRLRALVMDPATPGFWTVQLEPIDTPQVSERPIDVDAAIKNALEKRTDLQTARRTLETADINLRYYRNQTLPDVTLQASYAAAGLGGTRLVRSEGFPGEVVGRDPRGFGTVIADVLGSDFPTWTFGLTIGYPIGTSTAEASLARGRLQYSQAQIQIKNIELQVATQVREITRQVNTNLKRVEATRVARQLAERRLEAEQKKFGVGISTSFLVFQAQRDLAATRNSELRAVLDYNRSLVDFEAFQETSIDGGTITLSPSAGLTVGSQPTPTAGQELSQATRQF